MTANLLDTRICTYLKGTTSYKGYRKKYLMVEPEKNHEDQLVQPVYFTYKKPRTQELT